MNTKTHIVLPVGGVAALTLFLSPPSFAQSTTASEFPGQPQLSGPTLEEPFHVPTITDVSTLDVVVLEDWHVDSFDGTTRQKLIDIHVDDWWDGWRSACP